MLIPVRRATTLALAALFGGAVTAHAQSGKTWLAVSGWIDPDSAARQRNSSLFHNAFDQSGFPAIRLLLTGAEAAGIARSGFVVSAPLASDQLPFREDGSVRTRADSNDGGLCARAADAGHDRAIDARDGDQTRLANCSNFANCVSRVQSASRISDFRTMA